MPTWILSMGLLSLSMIMMVAGLILDSVARGRAEQKRIYYLGLAPAHGVPLQDNAAVAAPLAVSRAG